MRTLSEAWRDLGGGVIPFPNMKKSPSRGRRWEEDETIPAQWLFDGHALRKKHGMPRINLNLEAEKFQNWALSASGNVAVKVNWKRTFLNWCVNARGVPEAEPATAIYTPADNDRKLIELALRGVRTMNFGPDLVRRALQNGTCSEAEARRLGY